MTVPIILMVGERHGGRLIRVGAAHVRYLGLGVGVVGVVTVHVSCRTGAVTPEGVAVVGRRCGNPVVVTIHGVVSAVGHGARMSIRRCEASDLEAFRGLDQTRELSFRHRCLPLVHEVDDALYFPSPYILQHDDGVLAGIVDEDLLKIGTAKNYQ